MKPLSEQLDELSSKAKKVEDVVSAAKEKNRTRLEAERADLESSVAAGNAKAAGAESAVQEKWDEAHASANKRFAEMRAARAERKAERDIRRAENQADEAEEDAADAIDFALYVLDEAEYAIADAVIARADAIDLALSE